MQIAVIEKGHREYIWDQFNIHSGFKGNIVCFVEETSKDDWNKIPVKTLEELKDLSYDAVFIAIEDNHYLSLLLEKLHERRITNIYILRLFVLQTHSAFIQGTSFDESCVDKIRNWEEKPYLVHLETHVCDNCNLNCVACNNYAPFVKGQSETNIEQFEQDLRSLSSIYRIGRFFLLGGEPLLAPQLCLSMICLVRKYFPNVELRVLTNATLVTKMTNEFWEIVRDNGVIIHISLYPPVRESINDIEAVLRKNEITYTVFRVMTHFIKRLTRFPLEDEAENNKRCLSAGCHFLREGTIAKCPASVLVGNMDSKLKYNDVTEIDKITDAYEAISVLNGPCELCKNCSVSRQELIEWKMIGFSPQKEDWFIEDRLTLNNRLLAKKNEELLEENALLKESVSELQKEVNFEKEGLNRTEAELHEAECKIDRIKENEIKLKSQIRMLSNQLSIANNEITHINNSLSNRLGLVLTWIPRKVRKLLKSIISINHKLKRIKKIFTETVLEGYKVYSKIIERYGADAIILGNAIKGTGDYYICGQYLRSWLNQNGINNYVFITLPGSQKAVTLLFSIYKNHTYEVSFKEGLQLRALRGFAGTDKQNFIFLDHQFPFPNNPFHNIRTKNMMGFHGWNIHDFYLYFGFGVDKVLEKDNPLFIEDNSLLLGETIKEGKTALLSPYSESNKDEFGISSDFWIKLAEKLNELGYLVYTNCANNEEPIVGTKGLFIPFINVVPFMNRAGLFIGFRSGLCDMVSSSACKKIIIHNYKTFFWPDGESISYTGLKNMGLCDDAVELMMTDKNGAEIFETIISEVMKG